MNIDCKKSNPAVVNTNDLTVTWEGDWTGALFNGRYKLVQGYDQTHDEPVHTFALFIYPSNGTTDLCALETKGATAGWYPPSCQLFYVSQTTLHLEFPVTNMGGFFFFGVRYSEE